MLSFGLLILVRVLLLDVDVENARTSVMFRAPKLVSNPVSASNSYR
jgi:hypothetical protein